MAGSKEYSNARIHAQAGKFGNVRRTASDKGASMKRKKGNKEPEQESTVPEEAFEEGSWECTVCTYRNLSEAFKCGICDTRCSR